MAQVGSWQWNTMSCSRGEHPPDLLTDYHLIVDKQDGDFVAARAELFLTLVRCS